MFKSRKKLIEKLRTKIKDQNDIIKYLEEANRASLMSRSETDDSWVNFHLMQDAQITRFKQNEIKMQQTIDELRGYIIMQTNKIMEKECLIEN